jgi:hypothetical protein
VASGRPERAALGAAGAVDGGEQQVARRQCKHHQQAAASGPQHPCKLLLIDRVVLCLRYESR